eukprot:Gb_24983 [translate_table: standard]
MGNMDCSIEQILSFANDAKLHGGMCRKFAGLVYKIVKIFPSLEAVQPGCMPGIQSLCSLHLALDKAKSLLQHCAECSKLYLAITGDSVLAKFVRIKGSLDQSLSSLKAMVPRSLAQQIAEIVKELEETTFALELSEKEVSNDVITLLQQDKDPGSLNNISELEAFHWAAERLGIISPRDVLTEKRALKKLLDKAHSEKNQRKASVIIYLLRLLRKYSKLFQYEYLDDVESKNLDSCFQSVRKSAREVNMNGRNNNWHGWRLDSIDSASKETHGSSGGMPVPPEEFRCPISLQLMSEPVVISSGQTYEQVCIEKWFSEGHDTCPKTQQKLSHLSITPNYCLKGLIASWCEKHGINVPDPVSRPLPPAYRKWDICQSRSGSVTSVENDSLGVNANPLEDNKLPCSVEDDVIPTGYFGDNCCCDSPFIQKNKGSSEICNTGISWSCNMIESQKTDEDTCKKYERLLTNLMTPPLELQCGAAEEVQFLSKGDDKVLSYVGANGFIPALVSFLQSAINASDANAQKTGALALLSIAKNNRNKELVLSAGALPVLLDLLKSETTEVAVAVLMELSSWVNNKSSIAASGAIPPLIELLESESDQCRQDTLNVLYNLSTIMENWSSIVYGRSVSKLVHLLGVSELAEKCITILYNLAGFEEGRATIAETEGCILAIVELLDTGTHEEQAQAAATLLLLCTNSFEHSQLVLREGVIPSLVTLSVNGNPRGRDVAQKLLEHFREQRQRDFSWKFCPQAVCNADTTYDAGDTFNEKRTTFKRTSKKISRKMNFFWKLSSLLSASVST